jgi:hypothetical protein
VRSGVERCRGLVHRKIWALSGAWLSTRLAQTDQVSRQPIGQDWDDRTYTGSARTRLIHQWRLDLRLSPTLGDAPPGTGGRAAGGYGRRVSRQLAPQARCHHRIYPAQIAAPQPGGAGRHETVLDLTARHQGAVPANRPLPLASGRAAGSPASRPDSRAQSQRRFNRGALNHCSTTARNRLGLRTTSVILPHLL